MSMKSVSAILSVAACALIAACSSPSAPTPDPGEAKPAPAVSGSAVTEGPGASGATAEPEKPVQPAEIRGHFSVVSDEHTSRVTWTALKNGDAKVEGDFTRIAGGLFLDPADLSKMDGTFDVHLGDIDSKNPLRDANISELLFGAGDKAPATAIVEIRKVSPAKTTLAVGESTSATAEFNLGLRSGAVPGTAEVTLTRVEEGRWRVASSKPIMVSLEKLSLSAAAEALRVRCAHQSIGDGVELSLALELMNRPTE
jgi:polyisoprenoid-binding protein YceI